MLVSNCLKCRSRCRRVEMRLICEGDGGNALRELGREREEEEGAPASPRRT
jgi:hypothetical protein